MKEASVYLAVGGRRVKTIVSPMLSMDWTSGAPWYGYMHEGWQIEMDG